MFKPTIFTNTSNSRWKATILQKKSSEFYFSCNQDCAMLVQNEGFLTIISMPSTTFLYQV